MAIEVEADVAVITFGSVAILASTVVSMEFLFVFIFDTDDDADADVGTISELSIFALSKSLFLSSRRLLISSFEATGAAGVATTGAGGECNEELSPNTERPYSAAAPAIVSGTAKLLMVLADKDDIAEFALSFEFLNGLCDLFALRGFELSPLVRLCGLLDCFGDKLPVSNSEGF